ncbi:MAG: hypothetical protein JNM00_14980, partial [Flavobacteriales bacterium]|nr:hypothetical protein [Flavobacteriales bacterium]
MIRHFIAVPIIILSVVIFSNQGVLAQWGIHDTLDASMLNDDLDEL